MKKRVVLYPFSERSLATALWLDKLSSEYELSAVVAPPGLNLTGKDAGYADNRNNTKIIVSENLDEALQNADALFVPFGELSDTLFKDITEVMSKAAGMGKDVISCVYLSPRAASEISRNCMLHGSRFVDCTKEDRAWKRAQFKNTYETQVPVVFVGGILHETNELEVSLALAECFKRDGLRVTFVGFRPELNFFGYHCSKVLRALIQGRFYEGSARSTIKALNYYFHWLEIKEQTDVFIVHAPGALIDSQEFPNDCGVYAGLLSHAIRPSCFIGGSLFAEYGAEDIERLDGDVRNRLDCGLAAIHISNKALSYFSSVQNHAIETINCPQSEAVEMAKALMERGLPVFNTADGELFETIYQNMQKMIWEE